MLAPQPRHLFCEGPAELLETARGEEPIAHRGQHALFELLPPDPPTVGARTPLARVVADQPVLRAHREAAAARGADGQTREEMPRPLPAHGAALHGLARCRLTRLHGRPQCLADDPELRHVDRNPRRSRVLTRQPPPRVRVLHMEKHARPEKNGRISVDAIRSALRHGPMPPRELASALHATAYQVKCCVKQLEAQGVIKTSGTTTTRRIALADRPAKGDP
jgi:hypothetical protein